MIPTGSTEAAKHYAKETIAGARIPFVNGMPKLIISNDDFETLAIKHGVPIIGDDFKNQLGATILNRALVEYPYPLPKSSIDLSRFNL